MNTQSGISRYEQQKQAANDAFDAHCEAWNLLVSMKDPTLEDIQRWIDAKNLLSEKQSAFEKTVKERYQSGLA